MTAAVRHQKIRLDPVAVFTLRCWARATLWESCEFDLHEAVDELQAAADRDGLAALICQDEVQRIMAAAFGGVR
jgi:hypothetical protein